MNAHANRKQCRDPRLIEGVLANLPLMEGVSKRAIRELSTQSALLTVKRGEIIVRRGERVTGLHAIAYGAVKKRLPRAGGEAVIALLRPGETFAEVPALLDQASKVEAVALADTMLVVVNARCIHVQTQSDPRLARNLVKVLARRLEALMAEFERGALPGVRRLALYLEPIADPVEGSKFCVARLPVSKTLVAARLGMKKETLSRLLRELTARGLIAVDGRDIRIFDRDALAALSG
jgi:CRP-like cAMP-binding protein